MEAPKSFWIGIVCAIGGCTQLLNLDQDYRPSPIETTGSGGSSGFGGMGGLAGSGGNPECLVEADCNPSANTCTKNTCVNNVCVTNNLPAGTTCTPDGANVCDGNGICGNCMTPSDCTTLPKDDECRTRTCIDHICGQTFTAKGTKLTTQVSGDCVETFCDGAGNTINQPANMDLPEDGNPCTRNVCNAGTPSFPFEPLNTGCGTDGACDGAGTCKSPDGAPCLNEATCSSGNCIDGYCCNTTCTQKCRACNVTGLKGTCSTVPAGYSDDTCTSPKSCNGTTNGNNCDNKYPMGYPCTLAGQCGSGICIDGVCCNGSCLSTCQSCNVAGMVGTCANVLSGQEDPVATTACTGVNSCNGAGMCLLDNGQPCTGSTQCFSNNCTGMPMTCQ